MGELHLPLYLISFFLLSDLAYNIALCHYSLKQYAAALKYIREIIERGIREHPGPHLALKISLWLSHMGVTFYFLFQHEALGLGVHLE